MKMTREGKDRKWLLLIVFVALGAALWIQAPKIADEYRINEDFRTFYWMSRFQDPSLFADDPIRRSLKHSYSNVSLLGREVPVFAHSLAFEMLYWASPERVGKEIRYNPDHSDRSMGKGTLADYVHRLPLFWLR
jgi:hypothetical protein